MIQWWEHSLINNLFNLWGFKQFIQFGFGDKRVFAFLDLRNIMVLRIMIELVTGEIELLHRFGYRIILRFFGCCHTFGYIHVFLGIVHHDALFLLRNGILGNETIDCGQSHTELLLHFLGAIPFGNVWIWGFLGEVSIYMFLAPVGLATIESSGDVILLGYHKYP